MATRRSRRREERADSAPASTLYALGSVLYHMLTGRPPFLGETVLDTLQHVKNDDPIPPGRLRPRVPRDLEVICLKCLQKEPRKRYASAQDLADDLARFLRNRPIRARPIGDLERTWKWIRRQPMFAALLATLVLVIVGGFFVVLRLWLRAAKLRGWALEEMNESKVREQRATTRLNDAAQDLHVAQMNSAQEALKDADVPRLRKLLDSSAAGLRGFEWRYLNDQSNSPGLELRRHLRDVRSVAFRPDDCRQFASAGGDGLVLVLWDAGKPSPRIPARPCRSRAPCRLLGGRETSGHGRRNRIDPHLGRRVDEDDAHPCGSDADDFPALRPERRMAGRRRRGRFHQALEPDERVSADVVSRPSVRRRRPGRVAGRQAHRLGVARPERARLGSDRAERALRLPSRPLGDRGHVQRRRQDALHRKRRQEGPRLGRRCRPTPLRASRRRRRPANPGRKSLR